MGVNDVFWRTVALEATDFACSSLTVAWVKGWDRTLVTCNWKYISKLSVATEAEGVQIFASRSESFIHRERALLGENHFISRTVSDLWPTISGGIRQKKTQLVWNDIDYRMLGVGEILKMVLPNDLIFQVRKPKSRERQCLASDHTANISFSLIPWSSHTTALL